MTRLDLVHHLIDRIYETGVPSDEILKSVFVSFTQKAWCYRMSKFQENFSHEPCFKGVAENYGTMN